MDKIQIVFKDDSSIKFLLDGKLIPPRSVLMALEKGEIVLDCQQEYEMRGDNVTQQFYIKSETWTLIPKMD
jgi:hypothetical protein